MAVWHGITATPPSTCRRLMRGFRNLLNICFTLNGLIFDSKQVYLKLHYTLIHFICINISVHNVQIFINILKRCQSVSPFMKWYSGVYKLAGNFKPLGILFITIKGLAIFPLFYPSLWANFLLTEQLYRSRDRTCTMQGTMVLIKTLFWHSV